MLVRLLSSTDGQLQMFADVAGPLLRVLGKTPAPRGVITLEELPAMLELLEALRAGAGQGEVLAGDAHAQADLAAHELPVSLRQRLTPMIELMRRTLDNEGYLLWEAPPGFGDEG